MSHFETLKTNITEQDLLLKTLDNLNINWFKKKVLRNRFNKQSYSCEIIIKQKNDYEIGFKKNNNNNSYELIYDEMFWNQSITISQFKEKLQTFYTLNSVTKILNEEGFQISNKVQNNNFQNIKIKFTALRYN
uniref:Ycf35 n=1 Tax=Vacuolaria virescens TaxID=44451 RepID=UPI002114A03A|nr:Ycf35 [Vacuolaria virescens]UTE94653.1 Ycf35 [Vacuolaria virescens]